MIAGLLVGLAVLIVVLVIQSAERSLCSIEQKGAAARPYLVSSLQNIHDLLNPPAPLSAAEKRREAQEPHATRILVAKLSNNLAAYISLENQQPAPSSCS